MLNDCSGKVCRVTVCLYLIFCLFLISLYRSNFLKLDVYYAALQRESIDQISAYGAMDFLGKNDQSYFNIKYAFTSILIARRFSDANKNHQQCRYIW